LSRRFKKVRGFIKKKRNKPKHNWSNDGGSERKMLDMKRERYFRLDLKNILDKTANQDNKKIIAATIANTATKDSIMDALEYVDRLSENTLESDIRNEIKKLLEEYSTIR